MKVLRGLFRVIVGVVILLYGGFLLAPTIPVVQRWLVQQTQIYLGKTLGTKVKVGRIDVTMYGYAQIDSLVVEDRLGYPMLLVSRVTANCSLRELFEERVKIDHLQLYGLRAALRQEKADSAWNYQFVIDAFQSDDEKKDSTGWDIFLNSIRVRRASVSIDRVPFLPYDDGFDPNHIFIKQLSFNAKVISIDKGDSLEVIVDRFGLAEQSGLRVTDLALHLSKNNDNIELSQCKIRLPQSSLALKANMRDKVWWLRTEQMHIATSDFMPLMARTSLHNPYGEIDAHIVAFGDTAKCHLDTLMLRHDAVRLMSNADVIFSPLSIKSKSVALEAKVPQLVSFFPQEIKLPAFCADDYPVSFNGSLRYSEAQSFVHGTLAVPQGELAVDATMHNQDKFECNVGSTDFNLSPMLNNAGNVTAEIKAEGSIKRKTGTLQANIPNVVAAGRQWNNIALNAQLRDNLQLDFRIKDPIVAASLNAEGNLKSRHITLAADIDRIYPYAFSDQKDYDTTFYAGCLQADVTIPKDPLQSTGFVCLREVSQNDYRVIDSLMFRATQDSLQHYRIESDFMRAQMTTSGLKELLRNRKDDNFFAHIRLWDDTPLDSVIGLHLDLLDTLRVDARGEDDALAATLGFKTMLQENELHIDAKSGYLNDSLWVDITLQSPTDYTANGRVAAHTSFSDSTGIGDVHATAYNLNVGYIMNLVDFHAVEFDGWASGDIEVTKLQSRPFIDGLFDIRQFTFNNAAMGNLDLNISFDTNSNTIGLDGFITDPPNGHSTLAYGYVRPGHRPNSGMDLRIRANHINTAFINDFTEGIFEDVQGRASGDVRVYGKMKQIDLHGDIKIDEMSLKVPLLNTEYAAAGDSVHLRPGVFDFPEIHINDKRGGTGVVTGKLTHEHFDDIKYDFSIAANHILGYDFRDFLDMPFYATAVMSGTARISGSPGVVAVEVQGRPDKGTQLVYSTTTSSAATSDKFITYSSLHLDTTQVVHEVAHKLEEQSSTDIKLLFNLDVTPEAKLRVITDASTNDALNLYGRGKMQARYHNKGAFTMRGVYTVEEGDYQLSIQGPLKKKFTFKPGGTMKFDGAPMNGELNLQAVYPVHNVSLGDLSSRSTFARTSVRVDCLMNLLGKCEAPRVTFDFDLHNVNEDEKKMVRSLISTDEERNMQVLYLLGIGRFYSYDYTGNVDQGNLAMKSLLSSTISSTINDIVANAVGQSNWSFGTSIATGDVGWSDMDIEGLVSGRLLNNRLLVDGQFGYRDRLATGSNFVGDFDVKWLLTKNGNVAVKAYNQTNDRYFTKSSLTTQGIGLVLKKDFNHFTELFKLRKKLKTQ